MLCGALRLTHVCVSGRRRPSLSLVWRGGPGLECLALLAVELDEFRDGASVAVGSLKHQAIGFLTAVRYLRGEWGQLLVAWKGEGGQTVLCTCS